MAILNFCLTVSMSGGPVAAHLATYSRTRCSPSLAGWPCPPRASIANAGALLLLPASVPLPSSASAAACAAAALRSAMKRPWRCALCRGRCDGLHPALPQRRCSLRLLLLLLLLLLLPCGAPRRRRRLLSHSATRRLLLWKLRLRSCTTVR